MKPFFLLTFIISILTVFHTSIKASTRYQYEREEFSTCVNLDSHLKTLSSDVIQSLPYDVHSIILDYVGVRGEFSKQIIACGPVKIVFNCFIDHSTEAEGIEISEKDITKTILGYYKEYKETKLKNLITIFRSYTFKHPKALEDVGISGALEEVGLFHSTILKSLKTGYILNMNFNALLIDKNKLSNIEKIKKLILNNSPTTGLTLTIDPVAGDKKYNSCAKQLLMSLNKESNFTHPINLVIDFKMRESNLIENINEMKSLTSLSLRHCNKTHLLNESFKIFLESHLPHIKYITIQDEIILDPDVAKLFEKYDLINKNNSPSQSKNRNNEFIQHHCYPNQPIDPNAAVNYMISIPHSSYLIKKKKES